jgi:type II secretory pathway predicted ATPase ExeA
MYNEYFKLEKLPFENVPDPDFFFDSGAYSRSLNALSSSIDAGRGLMVISGPIGSGKTNLSHMIMQKFEGSLHLIWMAEPPENGMDLLLFLTKELRLSSKKGKRVSLIHQIREKLLGMEDRCLLIIDEAHLLTNEVAATLKTLTNLELKAKKLIQVLLLGQEELVEFIDRKELVSFKQRIATYEILGRMENREIKNYINFRLRMAGANNDLFTEGALQAVIIASEGIPRVINTLCSRALDIVANRQKLIVELDDIFNAALGQVDRKVLFHLKLSLTDQVQIIEESGVNKSSDGLNEFDDDTVKRSSGLAQAASTEGIVTSTQPEFTPQFAYTWWGNDETTRKGLFIPLIHLVLSLVVLALSLYYWR